MTEPNSADCDVLTEWAVRTPRGYFHLFTHEETARIVAREQSGELLSRTVTYSPWTRVTASAEGSV